jgi:predicted transcriptional regulator
MRIDDEHRESAVRYKIIKPGYRVGDDGSVWSCIKHNGNRLGIPGNQWRRLSLVPQRSGHLNVHLGRVDRRSVHTLVLEAFVGPRPDGTECRHLDGNPANNRVENLAWGTKLQNEADKVRHGTLLTGEKHPNVTVTEADVREILAIRGAGKRIEEIARWFGVSGATIRRIVHGQTWRNITDVVGLPPAREDKGTLRGEENGRAILTEANVLETLTMREKMETYQPDSACMTMREQHPSKGGMLSDSMSVRYKEIKPGYRIGEDGSVWSCLERARLRGWVITDRWHRIKAHRANRYGHLKVFLSGRDHRSVHRLVLEAFVGPCPPGMMCRHLDGDPTNNRLENLVWGTKEENAADRVRHGRAGEQKGEKNGRSVLTGADVLQALTMYRAGEKVAAIATQLGVYENSIRNILKGRSWRHITAIVGLPKIREDRGGLKGEKNGQAVLTPSDVHEAMARHQTGEDCSTIAQRLRVNPKTIKRIIRGEKWNHITGLPVLLPVARIIAKNKSK